MAGFRTPLSRARGLGSAKHGVGHFIGQRVSAVALIFLVLWGVRSALFIARSGDYGTARLWLASPLNATLLIATAGATFYHMRIGMAVIVEDYIHRPGAKAALLIVNTFVCYGGAALTAVCLLKVAMAGGAS